MDEDKKYVDMKKWKDATSWEHLVECIDTVERMDNGELLVYFTLYVCGPWTSFRICFALTIAVTLALTVATFIMTIVAGNTERATGRRRPRSARERCRTWCVEPATASGRALKFVTHANLVLRQLIDFYQSNLRWKPSNEDAMDED